MKTDIILNYFPNLTSQQREQFESMGELYYEWNEKINVISRKDINNLYERHILHSLAIAAFLGDVVNETTFVDVGTGGGFPGIPLAILYPNAKFHLVDRIAKKLRVANEVSNALGLKNITLQHGDMSECRLKFDYAVSRAVMSLDGLVKLVRRNISNDCRNAHPNGLICLKGGDLTLEAKNVNYPVIEYPINEFFKEEFFDTKQVVYVPMVSKPK